MKKYYILASLDGKGFGESIFTEDELGKWIQYYLENGIPFQVNEIKDDFKKKVESLKTRCEELKEDVLSRFKENCLCLIDDEMKALDISDADVLVEYSYFGIDSIKEISLMITIERERLRLTFHPSDYKMTMSDMSMCSYTRDNRGKLLLDCLKYKLWNNETLFIKIVNDLWNNLKDFKEVERYSMLLKSYDALVKEEKQKEGK